LAVNEGWNTPLTRLQRVTLIDRPSKRDDFGSQVSSMESCVMDKLELSLWGLSLSAQGTLAIIAAVLIVVLLMAFYRFGKSG
jgi:hypothetical protein